MRRTLLVTNDFPPRIGGIQSYVYEIARRLDPDRLVVLASDHPGSQEFDAEQAFRIVRHPTTTLLPTPRITRRAAALIAEHDLTAAWFGAAAPLALMTPSLRRAGVMRTIASTHGHEVGWSMIPGPRQMLRRIGGTVDVVTYVSLYARRRISAALGPMAALEALSPGVDSAVFRPDAGHREAVRARHGWGDAPIVACVSRLVPRKGQDTLITIWPTIRQAHPGARLVIVGDGPYGPRLRRLAAASAAADTIDFVGDVPHHDLPGYFQAADIFAMPCRTRGGGLDVEGLGIVFLEASACGLPVIAGDSGGAPETVHQDRTGTVVSNPRELTAALLRLVAEPDLARRWGEAGRHWARHHWGWEHSATRLADLLDG